jgi:hypothetical protein
MNNSVALNNDMKKVRKLLTAAMILMIVLLTCLWSTLGHCAKLSLSWDASTSNNVGGYEVNCGLSAGTYTIAADAGNVTTYTLDGLDKTAVYFCAVRSYDTTRTIKSVFSNEVSAYAKEIIVPAPVLFSSGFAVHGVLLNAAKQEGGTAWTWSLPGALNSSIKRVAATPVYAIYKEGGVKTVTLTVTINGADVSHTQEITVP